MTREQIDQVLSRFEDGRVADETTRTLLLGAMAFDLNRIADALEEQVNMVPAQPRGEAWQ
jgi:hypothetical protein